MADEQYYALCVETGDDQTHIAFIHLGRDEEFGTRLAIALYTSPTGKAQQTHMERYADRVVEPIPPYEKVEGNLLILPVSRDELIDTIQSPTPDTVLVNGKKNAAHRFKAMLKEQTSKPISRSPEIVGPPMPKHKATDLEKAVGKIVSAVEFGVEASVPEWKHEGEAIVLHFTDDTALAIMVGSNSTNLSDEFEGLKPGDIHTDLMPIWVNRPHPE
jgi:hypothetical protein